MELFPSGRFYIFIYIIHRLSHLPVREAPLTYGFGSCITFFF